jgi:hypothetical protein
MTFENRHPSFFQQPKQSECSNTAVQNPGDTSTKTVDKILGCSQESSKFSNLFFSSKNIENIQKIIRHRVYVDSKEVIGHQSITELKIVMKSNYLEHGRVPVNLQDYPARIQELNERVAKSVVPGIVSGIRQYRGYLIDAAKAPDFLDRPVNDSNAGTKENRSTTNVLFGEKK